MTVASRHTASSSTTVQNVTFRAGVATAKDLLRRVEVPTPLDAVSLCRSVARERSREIRLMALAEDEEATGFWHDFEDYDMITYAASTSAYHQQAIILHELGHLVMDHYGAEGDGPIPQALLADFAPETLRRLRRRHQYLDEEEQAAEGFATAILDAADQLAQSNLGSSMGASDAERQRLAATFIT